MRPDVNIVMTKKVDDKKELMVNLIVRNPEAELPSYDQPFMKFYGFFGWFLVTQ